jgi:4-alpha-glucanotransferase
MIKLKIIAIRIMSRKDNINDTLGINDRCGGLLVHPTSLPGKYGIGDLGPEIYKFIDFLNELNLNLWQILPLGPTGYGNSPYQSFSAFAGNPTIISPEKLIELNLLSKEDCELQVGLSESNIDYGIVIPYKWQLLEIAFKNFQKKKLSKIKTEFFTFNSSHSFWLDDYSLFMSIKLAHDLKAWNKWDDDLKYLESKALESWIKNNENEILFQKFTQFIFFKQWNDIKNYANLNNIQIIGDIPIFVAYDSADVWAHPELYYLDDDKNLLYVAGVPPDYFSPSGQRWGNPLYKWDLMKKQDFYWWVQRIKHNLTLVDILRIDHFRGFESYWQIDANEKTAIKGKWVKGPGLELFTKLKEVLGNLPIIAENLGLITPEVEELLMQTRFPGMRVLQFAFMDESENPSKNKYFPHNFQSNTVVYTGTHDNQTTKAWFEDSSKMVKQLVLDYTNSDGKDVVGDLIRLAWSSVARMAIIPLQDLLRLGDNSRMNIPGTTGNNWTWRFTWDQITDNLGKELMNFSRLYDRN